MRRCEGGMGCGARGRASQAHPREAPAKPSARTKTGCLQWLDAAGRRAAEAARIGAPLGSVLTRKHGAGDRNRRNGAPKGATRSPMDACT